MKIHNLKIGTQLRLGLSGLLLLALLMGTLTWVQTDMLWSQTKGLYDHPLAVSRALGRLAIAEKDMSLNIRDLLLSTDEQESTAALQKIEVAKADAEQQFAILRDRYLGPRTDIENLQNEFSKWTALRDETTRLFRTGQREDAQAPVRPGGIQNAQAELVHHRLQTIDAFARNKADSYYRDASEQNDDLNRQLVVVIVIISSLGLIVFWLFMKGIRSPLKEITSVSNQFRQGNLTVRSRYVSANEFGTLASAFNAMADDIQTQIELGKSASQMAAVMLGEEEDQAFCRRLLKSLLQHTSSQLGAIYFLDDTMTTFEHIASIGLDSGSVRSGFSATHSEGEFGASLATRQIQRITDIHADTRFNLVAVAGELKPREIITVPIISDQTVVAVISLASVHLYGASSIQLINDIWSMLSARINGILAHRKLNALAKRLEDQNRELDEQKRELSMQANELGAQNTELEMQKWQLDEANRLKSAFLSNMSHELRTPLNSVIALSGVLNRRLAKTIPDEEYSYLEIIERNGKNLLSLINDILDLSRIEAGYEEVNFGHFNMRALCDEIADMLTPIALEKKIELSNMVPDNLPLITSDITKCRHILQNLISNAIKFTDHGQVAVHAWVADDRLRITITDTGIGIAAEHLPHIFDEFRQADGSTSRRYGGTGLGLTIARKYAVLLGGSLAVESTKNQGSTFTLQLPLRNEQEQVSGLEAIRSDPTPPDANQNPHRYQILVVEDNEPAIIQLTDILKTQGYHIDVARNGKQALEHIAQTVPDAMILDLMMPEVDGFEVLETVRATPATSQLPVLILTAKHVTREELSFLKGNHIHQLIQKGDINKDGLLAAISGMIRPAEAQLEADAAVTEAPTRSPERRKTSRRDTPLVLVAEDNSDSRRAAVALLQDHFQVIEATNGRSALEQVRAQLPDLVLMDIAMPVMDGIQALAAIRDDPVLLHIPVVAVTASAMKGDREEILAHGFDAYLSKPIDSDKLLATLTKVLDQAQ